MVSGKFHDPIFDRFCMIRPFTNGRATAYSALYAINEI